MAVIGSVAGPLGKEVPRFSEFPRAGIEVWHECGNLDLALWLDSQERLHDLRRAKNLGLRNAHVSGISVANHEVAVFLFEPGSNRHLGRLSQFNQCPKGKRDCLVPGCGTIPFNKTIEGSVSMPTSWPP